MSLLCWQSPARVRPSVLIRRVGLDRGRQTEVETLQRAIDHHLKTTTRLEAVRKETEAERDTAETKMLAMKKKYDAEVSACDRSRSGLAKRAYGVG